jgi:uridine phosphorylase
MALDEHSDWQDHILEIASGWLLSDVPDGQVPDSVILPLENPDLHAAETFYDYLDSPVSYRTLVAGCYRGRPVGVCASKFGAPAVAMTVQTLAHRGVRRVVGVGFCGGLVPEIPCGSLILPLACVRDDGTSSRHVDNGYPAVADLDLLNRLRSITRAAGLASETGLVFSTDAVLMESTALVQKWARHGVIAIDMESGALFTIARLAGIKAASILVASDNPAAKRRAEGADLKRGFDAAVRVAFDALVDLTCSR